MDELMTEIQDLMSFKTTKSQGVSLSDRIQLLAADRDLSTCQGLFRRKNEDRP